MLSWNSWYNPLDNIASAVRTVNPYANLSGFAKGGQTAAKGNNEPGQFYRSPTTTTRTSNTTSSTSPFIEDNINHVQEALDYYNNQNSGGSGTGSGSGSSAPAYDQEEMNLLNRQKSLYEQLLSGVDTFERDGLRDLNDSYQSSLNRAGSSRDRAVRNYGIQREDTTRAKQSALGSVNQNTNNLARSLRTLLGMASGSGSSAFQFAAPNAVARLASAQRSGVMEDYGVNERNLVQAEADAKTDYENLLEELSNERQSNERRLKQGVLTQRQSLNDMLGQIAADIANLSGGSGFNASQPYFDQYMNFQNQLQQLPSQYRTGVTARDVNAKPVSLRDYTVDRQALNANRTGGSSQYSPYAQFLNRQREEDERLG